MYRVTTMDVICGCFLTEPVSSRLDAALATAIAIQSVAMFCYDCWLKFRGSAWAVANHSCGQPAMGTFHNTNFKTSRLIGWRSLYIPWLN